MINRQLVPLMTLTARHVSKFYKEVDMLSWDDFNTKEETLTKPIAEQAMTKPAIKEKVEAGSSVAPASKGTGCLLYTSDAADE